MDILDQILKWGSRTPDRLAHISGAQTLNYGSLCTGAQKVASYINKEFGANRSPVVVYGHKESEMLIAFLGVSKSGRAYVPVDISTPESRLSQIVNAVQAPLVLKPPKIKEILAGAEVPLVDGESIGPKDTYYIKFTSGSTGNPKGVCVPMEGLEDFLTWMVQEQSFSDSTEVFLNQAPFSFDLSVIDLYLSLVTGGTLVSVSRDDVGNPAQLFRTLSSSRTSIWVSTPSFCSLCLQEPSFAEKMMPQLKTFLFCGEVLPSELANQLIDRFPKARVWNTYGPTEATVATTSIEITKTVIDKYPSLPVGKSKPRSQVLIMDEQSNTLPQGSTGEIVIVGANVALGYIGQPEVTAKVFFDYHGARAYRTGDLGFYKDGILFCNGRRDSQVKFHGFRIELGDIENNLRKIDGVLDAVVVPKIKDDQIEFLAAFVISSRDKDLTDVERSRILRKELAKTVPSYMVPQRIQFIASYPMNANGKADRKELAKALE